MTIILAPAAEPRDYDWLKETIASWSHRRNLASEIPTFIALAEARIATRLRSRLQEQSGTVTTTAGTQSATLPSTLLAVQSMSIDGVTASLDYLPPEQFRQEYSDSSYTGAPRAYTTIGSTVLFGPTPDDAYTVSITYRGTITPLSDEEPTNDLLTNWPNVYLHAAMIEVADFSENEKAQLKWTARFNESIEGVNLIDQHAGGLMRVRTDVRN